ncbi:membrane protein [Lentilactobacillus fungorum]|jgi:ABC-2 type transport system permease protein|uniref:Membrane protein n=1 Tax=Lentilactobacillus fungorum TaxID=2201250 RepID=A0ABQ3VXZ4_9LACO|nr:ABC transporter permease [Lentilactobacillus fungorum]GHP13775.1 membrane protein [Lentilactobacillus fungorum]
MVTLVKQEMYKLLHKKSTPAVSVVLLIIMTIFGVLSKTNPKYWGPKDMFVSMYTGENWVVLFMIAACSSIIAMEFQYGTIKELLYRKYYRGEILVSKWITMLVYSIYFFVLTFVYSLILKVILYNSKFKLSDTYANNHSIVETQVLGMVGAFLSVWLILSLVLLLANVFKSTAAAISIGIIGYFALSMVSGLMFVLMQKWDWLKWNPLNMMNLPSQIVDNSYHKMTLLSTPEMVWGSLIYTAIFMAISYVVFKRRSV